VKGTTDGPERRNFDIRFVIGRDQSCHGGEESDNLMGVHHPSQNIEHTLRYVAADPARFEKLPR
jgi:hypothetical protein